MNDKLHPALAEHAMEAELQLERERHRKTWRQLEQVRGLLGELREITSEYAWDVDLEARVDAALSQQPEPAPAQGELWAVHAQGPDELYAAFSREDAEQHAAALNDLPMPVGIQVSAIVIASPWPAGEHWKYLAEQERDHATELNARATRPAQTEQQPVARIGAVMSRKQRLFSIDILKPEFLDVGTELFAAPIAQTAISTNEVSHE